MKKAKYTVLGLATMTLLGGTLVFANENSTNNENTKNLIDDEKVQVIETLNKESGLTPAELPTKDVEYSTVESELVLDKELKEKENLERIGKLKINENTNDIQSTFIDTTTNEKLFSAQATNELGNASEYQNIILTEWYAGLDATVTATEVNDELAVIKSSDTGVDSVHVVTDEFIYTFGGDNYETLLKYASEVEYK